MKTKINKLPIIFLISALIVSLLQSIYFVNCKEGFFLDEALTFYLSNKDVIDFSDIKNSIVSDSKEQLSTEIFEEIYRQNTNLKTYDEIMDQYTCLNSGKFNYLSAYILQASDVHPPLYYFTINTFSSVFSQMKLKYIGFLVNIICLLFICLLIYRISSLVFDNEYLAVATVLFYGISRSFVNSSVFFRMYPMLTLWGILFLYLNIICMQRGYEDKKILRHICFVEFLAMFTQYFALFYILPVFILNVIFILRKKGNLKKYIISNVLTGLIYFILWPASIFHMLFTNRGKDVTSNMLGMNAISKLNDYKRVFLDGIFASSNKVFILFIIFSIVVVIAKLIQTKKNNSIDIELATEKNNIILYLAVFTGAYYFIAASLAPWFDERYMTPAVPTACILIVYVIYSGANFVVKNNNIIAFMVAFVAVGLCVKSNIKGLPYNLYNEPERIAYRDEYSSYDAIIVDGNTEILNSDIEMNFPHQIILETNDPTISTGVENIKADKDYVVYINKSCDEDEVLKSFEKMNRKLEEIDFETNFYKIYMMKSRL